jgi:hypothetical protein
MLGLKRISLKFFLLIISILLMPGLSLAYEVSVQVVNGTDESKIPVGMPITVHLLKGEGKDSKLLDTLIGESDASGIAHFSVEPEDGGSTILASAEYRGVTYHSLPILINQGVNEYDISIKVYELSDEDGLVYIKERRIFLQEIKDGVLTVVDGLTIGNYGNKTYVGRFNDKSQFNETVRIGLPYGYERPSIEGPIDTNQAKTMSNALILQEMIPPGERMLFIAYKIRSDIGQFELRYPVDTPYKVLKLLIPEDFQWNVNVKQLKKTDDLRLGQIVYKQWIGEDIEIVVEEGERLDPDLRESMGFVLGPKIILKDPAKAGAFGMNEVAITAGLLISIIFGFLYIKKNAHTIAGADSPSQPGGTSHNKLSEEKSRLNSLLKRLDRELDGNQEEREFYKPHRTILLNRIKDINGVLKNEKSFKGRQKS